jgi:anti-sigma regulatory factor (Ser/Thr protein kinase)
MFYNLIDLVKFLSCTTSMADVEQIIAQEFNQQDLAGAKPSRLPTDMPMCHDPDHDTAALLGSDLAGTLGSMNTQTAPVASTEARCCRLPAEVTAPSTARSFAREVLIGWGLVTVLDDVALCASELVTNAVLHGGGPVTVRLSCLSGGAVLCEVADAGPWVPRAYEPGPGAEQGRGLALVTALASVFGARPGGCHGERNSTCNGKTVWFCMEGRT